MRAQFIAYAGDCRVSGALELDADQRLTDVLNASREIVLRDAVLVAHADGREVREEELALDRDDLFAVQAIGSRGMAARRLHTVRHRLEMALGPYAVLGQLHTLPGAEPLVAIPRRQPMIPLTNATLAFNGAGGIEAHDIETLVVNRELVDWVRADAPELAHFPGVRVAGGTWPL